MSKPVIMDARPVTRKHAFTATTVANTLAATVVEELDMGTVSRAATPPNTNVQALTELFPTDFDDSVYETVRTWIAGNPLFSGHTWVGKWLTDYPWAATQNASIVSGAAIPGNPWGGVGTVNEGAASSIYDAAANLLETFAIQLQVSPTAEIVNSELEKLMNPILTFELSREDAATTKLRYDKSLLDRSRGTMFTFTDVILYEVITISSVDYWQPVMAIKDESFDIDMATETVDWENGKPLVTFHQAISKLKTDAKFTCYDCDPRWIARALHTTPQENTTNNTVEIEYEAISRPVLYGNYVMKWRTKGGHLVRVHVPRAALSLEGGYKPGEQDFAGRGFMLKGLASGPSNLVSRTHVSRVAMEEIQIPLKYNVTA